MSKQSSRKSPRPSSAKRPTSRFNTRTLRGTTAGPLFANPNLSSDPTSFKEQHPSDKAFYNELNKSLLAIPPVNVNPPILKLSDAWGPGWSDVRARIKKAGRIVFQSGGDSGSVIGVKSQNLVADKLVGDFHNEDELDTPSFIYHLGDVVYSFGETKYYYDQFYEPYRDYPAPIFAIAGNHDGMTYREDQEPGLAAFLRNFCSAVGPVHTPEAGGVSRTAMVQPGIYFTLDSDLVRIIGLFSNVLEDPGVVSGKDYPNSTLGNEQLDFLESELQRVKRDQFEGAVLLATHHPPYTGGESHGGSPRMLEVLDEICERVDVWPHAHLSGHAHNYQRYTRTKGKMDIPYIVCGNFGHGLTRLKSKARRPLRTPYKIDNELTFESYFDQDYGYLRCVIDKTTARFEFHIASEGRDYKTPSDVVSIDLHSHSVISN